jgi:DNA repair exonuclease SbcCD ATPase subunit
MLITASASNFASYEKLEFDFSGQGLTLIQGLTGSGKSTLCDLVPWALFGKTAKGGAVDEVLSFPGDDVTSATVHLATGEVAWYIVRTRGPKAKDNDLYFVANCTDERAIRGKDLLDTQKLINHRLGMTYELYLAGAYYHEFSQTAQFFTTTAKNRRTICEQIVDLSLPIKLKAKIKDKIKENTKQLDKDTIAETKFGTQLDMLERMQKLELTKVEDWERGKDSRFFILKDTMLLFEKSREKSVEQIKQELAKAETDTVCSECGQVKLPKAVNYTNYLNRLAREETRENPYIEQLQELEMEVNPHIGAVKDYSDEISQVRHNMSLLAKDMEQVKLGLANLDLLDSVVDDMRSNLIRNTISNIQDDTNKLLSDHFDAEIRVAFAAQDADKLEVDITKDGHNCAYTQLSKGQRQLLKLCFGVAVMRGVSNHHGIKFEQLFFDEATDGLDEEFKNKAFDMLSKLAQNYDSVFLVEHSESLKARFSNSFTVNLVNGESQIEKT